MSRIRHVEQVSRFPLEWPEAKPRAAHRRAGQFKASLAKAMERIDQEMQRWRIGREHYVLSREPEHRRRIGDPGVALWFEMPLRDGQTERELRVIACDAFVLQDHNAWSIYLTLDALRAVERWGAYTLEQAVEGARAALPPPDSMRKRRWWDVLGCGSNWPAEAVELKYRELARKAHPDNGGTPDEMAALNVAIEESRVELARGQ